MYFLMLQIADVISMNFDMICVYTLHKYKHVSG